MRTNLVVTLLLNCGYAFMKLFFYEEAYRCFNYAIEIAPVAADAYLRRSQVVMYNKESSMDDLKEAVNDSNKALEKRPNDKFYKQHKADLENVINNYLTKSIMFTKEIVSKA